MSHISCLCGNDVRQNNLATVRRFVSDAAMRDSPDIPFFGLPCDFGRVAEIWVCDKCGRAMFFDDGGVRTTRIMRSANPSLFDPAAPAERGVIYWEDPFFDAVAEHLIREFEAGREPDYEFFYAEHADGKPLLTSAVMSEKIFANRECTFPYWSRALIVPDSLVEIDASGRAAGFWVLSKGDTACAARPSRYDVARGALKEHDLMGLNPGNPDGAPADEYDMEAEEIVDCLTEEDDAEKVSQVIATVFSRKFGTRFTPGECEPVAMDLVARWAELED